MRLNRFGMSTAAAFVIALALAASNAQGQTKPRFFHGWDSPAPGAVIRQSELTFIAGGWGFYCETGEHPPFAVPALFNLDTLTWVPLTGAQWFQFDHLARPDVAAAFRAACPKVHGYEGYQLYLTTPPAPGHYRVWVMWDEDHAFSRDITIIPG